MDLQNKIKAATKVTAALRNYFSQAWFPTVQEVLQADWQDVWHSPQPPFLALFGKFFVFKVLTCFINYSPLLTNRDHYIIV